MRKRWLSVALLTTGVFAGAVSAAILAPGVDVIPGVFPEGQQPDGNSVIFTAPDGLIVMDTGRHHPHTRRYSISPPMRAGRSRPSSTATGTSNTNLNQ